MSTERVIVCDGCGNGYLGEPGDTVARIRVRACAAGWVCWQEGPTAERGHWVRCDYCAGCVTPALLERRARAGIDAARRRSIQDAVASGTSQAEVARTYGVSRQRIHQIIAQGA